MQSTSCQSFLGESFSLSTSHPVFLDGILKEGRKEGRKEGETQGGRAD